jgi:hypothetical protein
MQHGPRVRWFPLPNTIASSEMKARITLPTLSALLLSVLCDYRMTLTPSSGLLVTDGNATLVNNTAVLAGGHNTTAEPLANTTQGLTYAFLTPTVAKITLDTSSAFTARGSPHPNLLDSMESGSTLLKWGFEVDKHRNAVLEIVLSVVYRTAAHPKVHIAQLIQGSVKLYMLYSQRSNRSNQYSSPYESQIIF